MKATFAARFLSKIPFIGSFFSAHPKLTGRQINMWEHSGWGDSIYFLNFAQRKVAGHLWDRPLVGDIINAKMKSGKIAQFIVIEVDYQIDPPDMFFARVSDFGYKETFASL